MLFNNNLFCLQLWCEILTFEHPNNNTFHFTAEFTCKNGQDEFRPDA